MLVMSFHQLMEQTMNSNITTQTDEWSASPCPVDPDNYWIDDETGERVNADTGKRTKIVISRVEPPIAVRSFDWCAYEDGREEEGRYGWGATKDAALRDFIENYGEGA